MGILTYVLGRSGTGKSYSMHNFKPDELAVINVQGKILPFKGSGAIETVNTDDSADIVKAIERLAKTYKTIVVDDFQYVMANEFMRRSAERGYDKFTGIARHAWDVANTVRTLPPDVIVYILCHTDTDADGFEKLKTIGKLLDEKIVLEGMSTIVLKTAVSDGQYMFLTQNNGHDTVKSPAGMFPSYAIENDLKYVDNKIRNYYELGEFLTDEEIKEIDELAAKTDVIKDEPKKKRSRKSGETKEKEQTDASKEEKEEKPKRSRRIKEELEKEREAVQAENGVAIATENGKLQDADIDEEIPYEESEPPKIEEPPKRKKRTKAEIEAAKVEESGQDAPPPTTTRRRRRTTETGEE